VILGSKLAAENISFALLRRNVVNAPGVPNPLKIPNVAAEAAFFGRKRKELQFRKQAAVIGLNTSALNLREER
jgi:hypothetical protein